MSFFSILFFLFLGFCAFIAVKSDAQKNKLRQSGIRATAIITDKFLRKSKNGVKHKIVYEFEVGGKKVSEDTRVTPALYENLEKGAQVNIIYDPANPSINSNLADKIDNPGNSSVTIYVIIIIMAAFVAVMELMK